MINLINGEALIEMDKLQSNSVDLIFVDLPYGTTQNDWDVIIPLDKMWEMFYKVLKEDGRIVLTAAQPFSSQLIMSNLKDFKYDIIWEKTISSGQLNVSKQPLRSHEHILVFYKKFSVYNEQLTKGDPYTITRKNPKSENYGSQRENSLVNEGTRRARSVIKIKNNRVKDGHPTQKPEVLCEYIIKTYSNEGEVVLDCCMGSGTSGVASKRLKREYIGIELNEEYFNIAKERIDAIRLTKIGFEE